MRCRPLLASGNRADEVVSGRMAKAPQSQKKRDSSEEQRTSKRSNSDEEDSILDNEDELQEKVDEQRISFQYSISIV